MPLSLFDRYALYELCAQAPAETAGLLRAIHRAAPLVLGEDFCGTAAASRAWVARGGRAVAVDRDPEVLARVARCARLQAVRGDVVRGSGVPRERVDVVYAGNFSIGEIHERAELVRYLRRSRRRLRAGGVFVCDTYGGASAWRVGRFERLVRGAREVVIRYTWEQRRADRRTRMVEKAMHFRVERRGRVVQEIRDAFVYRWRLWSARQLRAAMREAGFGGTALYDAAPGGVDQRGNVYPTLVVGEPSERHGTFIVCVAGFR